MFRTISFFSFYRNSLEQNRHFKHKPCKANIDNFQASIFYFIFQIIILKASMLLAFFNLSGKMFQILGARNEILSDL